MDEIRKTLNFSPDLIPTILSGELTSIWRLWDDKNLSEGDIVAFVSHPQITPFAIAKITFAVEKTMAELTSDEQTHPETYTEPSQRPVGSETPVKVIHFQLIKKNSAS